MNIDQLTFVLLLLCGTCQPSSAYRFRCIETLQGQCRCDTDEELVDCHGMGLERFPDISHRLRGFTILSLFHNGIASPLPQEDAIKRLLPDIKLIDLEGNPQVNCSEIVQKFRGIKVLSDCLEGGKDGRIPLKRNEGPTEGPVRVPEVSQTSSCGDMWCRIDKAISPKLLKAYAYLSHTWHKAKQRLPFQEIKSFWNGIFGKKTEPNPRLREITRF